ETPPRDRAEQARDDRVQWPARFEHGRKTRNVGRATVAPGVFGDKHRKLSRLTRTVIAFSRACDQVNLLFASRINDKIDETPLNLGPLIAHLMRQAMRVFLECLMQYSNNNQS